MTRLPLGLALAAAIWLAGPAALASGKANPHAAKTKKQSRHAAAQRSTPATARAPAGDAEARLIEVYKLAAKGAALQALSKSESLVRDYPNFHLAQLVYGDLLAARARPIATLGDVPEATARSAANALRELRLESQMRLQALKDRPASGAIPSQFLSLSTRNKHAIAVDASRSRLYLFQNSATGLTLIGDYYVSVGKSGTEKAVEGDLRTPLGVYFITSNLDPKTLKDFYGAGALPINYPNVLDARRGKTGSGIWLHGTPPAQFARAPLATDGCVVLANPDLEQIVRTVEVRTTPVVISSKLTWVAPHSTQAERKPFEDALAAWQNARSAGNVEQVLSFYTADFSSNGKSLAQWSPLLRTEVQKTRGRPVQLKDVSYLRWTDSNDTMVVTFGEVAQGARSGATKRQYWTRQGKDWKIFYEGVLG